MVLGCTPDIMFARLLKNSIINIDKVLSQHGTQGSPLSVLNYDRITIIVSIPKEQTVNTALNITNQI